MPPDLSLVHCDPAILGGKAVISDTRIGVDLLLERLAYGETEEQIRAAYPHLPEGALQAALSYAGACMILTTPRQS
jgi:uncharacterized protein (DUF433 family)